MTIAILLELSDKKYVEVKPQIYDYKGREKHILRCVDNVCWLFSLGNNVKISWWADEAAGYIQIVNKIWCKVEWNEVNEPN